MQIGLKPEVPRQYANTDGAGIFNFSDQISKFYNIYIISKI